METKKPRLSTVAEMLKFNIWSFICLALLSTPLHSFALPRLLNEQFLGGGAGGGEDAEEVGAAGPGGDVEGECVNV